MTLHSIGAIYRRNSTHPIPKFRFVFEEFARIGIYTNPAFVMTAREILAEAHKRFGKRAADLEFWISDPCPFPPPPTT